jgi:hypothetical protein
MRRELTCVSSPRNRSPLQHDAGSNSQHQKTRLRTGHGCVLRLGANSALLDPCGPPKRHHQGVIESAGGARHRQTLWISSLHESGVPIPIEKDPCQQGVPLICHNTTLRREQLRRVALVYDVN